MQQVVIFSQPNCVPCKRVKSWFDAKGVEYTERDITQDAEALQHIRDLGHQGVPVVETPTKSWVGIDIDNMKELVNA